jgi:hypothetical protein
MADYIGTAQYGKPIEYSSQPNGGMYPSWINTDYSGIFDALGESISGVIKAKKEAAEEEKKEKEKLEKENSALIEKYYIDMPETGDDSQYFLTKVDDYNNTAKGYIDAAISAGNSYLTPEQIVELKKKSNAILAEKNLSDLNQSTVSEVRNKYFSQEGQYDPTAFNDWMEGYNAAGTIQDKAKHIQQNKNPLVPVVTAIDAAQELKKFNIGTTTEKINGQLHTYIDPVNLDTGIRHLVETEPTSNVYKYVMKGDPNEKEKEERIANLFPLFDIQKDKRPMPQRGASTSKTGGSGGRNAIKFDTSDISKFKANYIAERGNTTPSTVNGGAVSGSVSRIKYDGDKVTAIYQYVDPYDKERKEISLDYSNPDHKELINSSLEINMDLLEEFRKRNSDKKDQQKQTFKGAPKGGF